MVDRGIGTGAMKVCRCRGVMIASMGMIRVGGVRVLVRRCERGG